MQVLLYITVFLCMAGSAGAQARFEKFFNDKTLRFDFYHCGDATTEGYYFDCMKEEPYWGGSKVSLVDTAGYGGQIFKLIDAQSGEVIYSRGYCTLFNEWQTTPEATLTSKCMPESVVMPYPKGKSRIEIHARNKKGIFEKKFEYNIDPDNYFIRKFSPEYSSFEVAYNGASANKVDVVLIPEGYTEAEKEKFIEACDNFAKELFTYPPFRENADKFNIRGVWAPSAESGVTIPGEHIWRNTATEASYYTFDVERYQMIEDFQRVRDIAAHVPYDYIYVLSNTQKYGGGGIFNFYGISAANHPTQTGKVYVHEFGHLLLGLGDEYVGGVAYNDMYPTDVEPWEENLTTLVDFKSKPWAKMVDPKTPIPTPVTPKNSEVVGVYEGGGYVSKGVYRPWPNCMMNRHHAIDRFCPVCEGAIVRYIDFLCR